MLPLRPALAPALLATGLAVTLPALAAGSLYALGYLYWTGAAWWMPADVAGPHPPLAWILGGVLPAAGLGYAMARAPHRRALRIAIGLWGLAQVAFAAYVVMWWSQGYPDDLLQPAFPVLDVMAFVGAAVVAVAFAAGSITRPRTRREGLAAGILAAVLSAGLSTPSIVRSVLDATPQDSPPFELRFVAAMPVSAADPLAVDDTIEFRGERFRMWREDAFVVTHHDVQRVHWTPDETGAPGLILVLREAEPLRVRSQRREGQSDALFLDGELVAVPRFEATLIDGRLYYSDRSGEDEGEAERLYRALTGLSPP